MQGVIEGSSFYLASMISDPTGPGWVELARQNVLATYCAGTPLAAILGANTACQRKINAILFAELRGDPDRYARLIGTMMRMATLAYAVMMSAISRYPEEQTATMRQGQARAFQQHITRTGGAASPATQTLHTDTTNAAYR